MTLLIILGIIAVIVFAAVAIYNKLVRLRNTVKSSWSDIDVQCKKRYDLVPNLTMMNSTGTSRATTGKLLSK
jgi:LemA protein